MFILPNLNKKTTKQLSETDVSRYDGDPMGGPHETYRHITALS